MIRFVLLLLLIPGVARAGDLAVLDAFSRSTPGGGPAVAYMTIQGGDAADRLLSARSPRAAKVTLHSMLMQGGVMRMRELDAIEVPAGAKVVLAPNAPLHLMLEGLTAPLRTGETVPVTLRFERAGERRVDVVVGPPGASAMPSAHAH